MNAPQPSAAEQARLAALADIVEPAAIGFYPPAPAWLLVALLALLLAVRGMQLFWRRWRRDRYRRLALRRLRPLESNSVVLPAQRLLSEALLVLRDCALEMPGAANRPADRAAWTAFLQSRLPTQHSFPPEALLHEAAYWPPDRVAREDALAVLRFVRSWVEHHDPRA